MYQRFNYKNADQIPVLHACSHGNNCQTSSSGQTGSRYAMKLIGNEELKQGSSAIRAFEKTKKPKIGGLD